MASDAVGSERISRIVGYKITKGDFRATSPNLPQRIALFAEVNDAKQSGLDTTKKTISTTKQAGDLYGYGSPIYSIMRILKPLAGDGVGGIPIDVFPIAKSLGATPKIVSLEVTGTATGNGTHTIVIGGRQNLDGKFYNISIEEGDTASAIYAKIADAINVVLGAPVTAVDDAYGVVLTTKWSGLTANDLVVDVETNDNALGLTYTATTDQAGSGTNDIDDALSQIGNEWYTALINGLGTVTGILNALEAFNGIPDPSNPTGRYAAIVMKPFIAITGSKSEDPSSLTGSRLTQVTNAIAPAPLSDGFSFEAAANMALLFSRTAQDAPHLDVSGKSYPDMPTPKSIGSMADYDSRDVIAQKGCSTVDLVNERYVVQDFVTTYHPVGEIPPQFRYCRNLMVDFNIRYGYYLREQTNVIDHVLANDSDIVRASNVVKPKTWKSVLSDFADDLVSRGLIVDAAFMQDSLTVNISTVNPDRFETFFRYKRSGVVRIASTTAEAGFNFGVIE